MSLSIYNTLSRTKEEFVPLQGKNVGMYVCGPTVYGMPHVGHAKSYVSFDIIHRYLTYLGYNVKYVQNITDVGHLVGDSDEGEDKIQKQARLEALDPVAIAYRYETLYFDCMDALGVRKPTISCRATGHIIEIIAMVQELIDKGYAYVTDAGNVYYRVSSFKDYGKLSHREIDETVSGSRISVADDKEQPEDFALWKKADGGHLMKWPSPWGEGYPGWKPNAKSEILQTAQATYKQLFGKEPKVKAIHAGLECGLFLEKYPHLDMISFGPTMRGVHSPDERLLIPTVELWWQHLVAVLEAAPKK